MKAVIIDPETECIRREKISKTSRKENKKRTKEYWQQRGENISNAKINMDPEKKKQYYAKVSLKRREEMARLGNSDKFKPSFNESTIPYIENVLNKKYNTIFIHALSESGEYRVHDKKCKRTYYADAYSPELNLWIEFDEDFHYYSSGELKEDCQQREDRIKNMLGCKFNRIKIQNIKEN